MRNKTYTLNRLELVAIIKATADMIAKDAEKDLVVFSVDRYDFDEALRLVNREIEQLDRIVDYIKDMKMEREWKLAAEEADRKKKEKKG